MVKKLLLHVCCAPCSTHVIEELKKKYSLTLYFYNPNIHPKEEYRRRLGEARKYAKKMKLPLFAGRYDFETWLKLTNGLEQEPEPGKRCAVCFDMRLDKTAEFAKSKGFDLFACTLTISPYKEKDVVNEMGKKAARKHSIEYLESDFKKNGGYEKSIELSTKNNIYRQNYCGCLYSMRKFLFF